MKKLLLASFLLSGCASITAGSSQTVAIDTNPQKAAECNMSNEKGVWYVKAPGNATVHKAYGPLAISCKAGAWSGNTSVQSTTVGAAYGNILAGGIIGGAIDMGSGAAYQYPAQIIVPLSKK